MIQPTEYTEKDLYFRGKGGEVCLSLFWRLPPIQFFQENAELQGLIIPQGGTNLKQNAVMTYESEIRDTLDRLSSENSCILPFSWFLECTDNYFDRKSRKKRRSEVVILGPGIPEELILSAGARLNYITGGSLRSVDWSDDLVPRDTDPVHRSILGFLNEPDGPDYSDTLFIVPVQNDSLRKIAWLLEQEDKKVHIVDIPPQREDPFTEKKWQEQMIRMVDAVSKHTGIPVTAGRLFQKIHETDTARKTFREFLTLTDSMNGLLTGSARLLVQNSYYYTDDTKEWTGHLQLMNEDLKKRTCTDNKGRPESPGVLLLGSPVWFPDYKVPFLIEDIGMRILRNIDPASMTFEIQSLPIGVRKNRKSMIAASADRWYRQDGSSSFIGNDVLYHSVERCLDKEPVEGVVYHVLKGQIEYDFELVRLESLFDRRGIPVFRLETDYQYQDLEQLRVRMEAFFEMLTQNRYRKERVAP